MSIDSALPGLAARLEYFESALERALTDAKRWEFDLPTEGGIARARELFAGLAAAFEDVTGFDVDVAVDGSVGVTAGGTVSSVTVEVSPDGRRVDATTGNAVAEEVTWSAKDPDLKEIVREIERAA